MVSITHGLRLNSIKPKPLIQQFCSNFAQIFENGNRNNQYNKVLEKYNIPQKVLILVRLNMSDTKGKCEGK